MVFVGTVCNVHSGVRWRNVHRHDRDVVRGVHGRNVRLIGARPQRG